MAIVLGNMTFTGGFQFTNSSTPPGPTPPSDPEFEYTTLLLDGLGTNGAQNNTFLDSSTNSFTITRNGNTTQGSFTPFSHSNGYWSNYFDGNGDYLSLGNSSNLTVSGDFTFEFWFMIIGTVGSGEIDFFESQTTNTFRVLKRGSSSGLTWDWYGQSEGALIKADADIVPNVWHHVAVSRISGTVRSYYDGTRVNTTSNSRNGVAPSAVYTVGGRNGGTNPLNGYVSNMRLVVGTGLYTGDTIQVPTTPLTTTSQGASETQVELLTCQSSRFMDNSTNNLAITSFGNTAASLFQPFTLSTEYNSSTMGGSMYFDGTGDYLSIAWNAAFALGTSNFTMEAWIYPNTSGAYRGIITNWQIGGAFIFTLNSSNVLEFSYNTGSTSTYSGTTVVPINSWSHVAVVRNGSTLTLYINGVAEASPPNIGSQSIGASGKPIYIGTGGDTGGPMNGFISSPRVVVGTAVYTSNFTPPTSPVTAISGTQLLLNGTNAGVVDSTGFNNAETVGNAQISTAQSKWGGSSMYFDGTGDYLALPTSTEFGLGTGDFTIEGWIYPQSTSTNRSMIDFRVPGSGSSQTKPTLFFGASNEMVLYTSNANRISSSALSTNQWYHVALVRSSGVTKMYLNGTQTGSNYTDTNNYGASGPCYVGAVGDNPGFSPAHWNGYMQGIRITKGIARYTGTFTPPTDY